MSDHEDVGKEVTALTQNPSMIGEKDTETVPLVEATTSPDDTHVPLLLSRMSVHEDHCHHRIELSSRSEARKHLQ